jgi:glucose-1-phosphate cytidylyltransferase
MDNKEIPVFILCGGLGTRLKEETEFRPKPMVPIGDKPILWHIMNSYSRFGFKKFILCLGFKSEIIKSYFLNYSSLNSDFTVNLLNNEISVHSLDHNLSWEVTLAYTGELNMTGSRIAIATEKYLGGAEYFAVTYGDGLTNADLNEEFIFHKKHGKIGTILGTNPPSRFGSIKLNGEIVEEFNEKPEFEDEWINGGYFFFRREFLSYISKDENCILERQPLVDLARDRQLRMFRHKEFWACMDTQRDREYLNQIWNSGNVPW